MPLTHCSQCLNLKGKILTTSTQWHNLDTTCKENFSWRGGTVLQNGNRHGYRVLELFYHFLIHLHDIHCQTAAPPITKQLQTSMRTDLMTHNSLLIILILNESFWYTILLCYSGNSTGIEFVSDTSQFAIATLSIYLGYLFDWELIVPSLQLLIGSAVLNIAKLDSWK